MLFRILLMLIGAAIGYVALLFGEQSLAVLSPVHWSQLDAFPWASFQASGDLGPLWPVVTITVAALTAVAILEQLAWVLSARTHFVPRSKIVYITVLLAAGAGLYGAFATPLSGSDGTLHYWFLRYPQSIPVWFIIAPMALAALNLLREIHYAVVEYGLRAGEGSRADQEIHKKLDAITRTTLTIGLAVHSMNDDIQGVVTASRHTAQMTQENKQFLKDQMDGLFRQLRTISAALSARQPSQPADEKPAPSLRPVNGEDHDGVRLLPSGSVPLRRDDSLSRAG